MLWGENRGKGKGQQSLGVKPRTLLTWATSALPPTLTIVYMNCTDWMPQLHTWQPLSMCCQNSVRGVDWKLSLSWWSSDGTAKWVPSVQLRQSVPPVQYIYVEVVWLPWLSDRAWSFDSTCWVTTMCATEAFSTACAVHVEDCGGICGCLSVMAQLQSMEFWWHSWVAARCATEAFSVPPVQYFRGLWGLMVV